MSDSELRTSYTYCPFGDVTQDRTPGKPDFPTGRTENWAFTAGTEPGLNVFTAK